MTTWDELAADAPLTATLFAQRLAATGLALLATIRRDGSPRISPVEPSIQRGSIWIGSMPGSTKSADLRRDGRCCLHSATADKDVKEGDAKLWGVAVEVTDAAERRAYSQGFQDTTGLDVEELPGGFDLFRLDLTAASGLRLGDDGQHLRITSWHAGGTEQITERR